MLYGKRGVERLRQVPVATLVSDLPAQMLRTAARTLASGLGRCRCAAAVCVESMRCTDDEPRRRMLAWHNRRFGARMRAKRVARSGLFSQNDADGSSFSKCTLMRIGPVFSAECPS